MIRELLSIFRPGNPLTRMAEDFSEMLQLTCTMTDTAGRSYFGESVETEERAGLYKKDIRVNKFERSIRKQIVAHLSVGNTGDLPYTLLLMSLVKDVERLGDYAKNLSEVADLHSGPLPDDVICRELREIRTAVEESYHA
jgi:phosphate uptake regulator